MDHHDAAGRARGARVRLFALALLGLVVFAPARGDVIKLTNGKILSGEITYEDHDIIKIDASPSVVSVARGKIRSIRRGRNSEESVGIQAEDAMVRARELLQANDGAQARQVLRNAMRELEKYLATLNPKPQALLQVRRELEQNLNEATSGNPKAKADQLYRRALDLLDQVDYERAYGLLKQAAALDTGRTDLQLSLARIADQRMHDEPTAIGAYRRLLELEPERYYADVAAPLLTLATRHGTALINQRQANQALEDFAQVLMLSGEQPGQPVSLSEYLKKKTEMGQKSQDQVLMEIYKYADGNDLIDLALASITQVKLLRPNDPRVDKLSHESDFLARYRRLILQGHAKEAAQLQDQAPPAIADSERVAEKLKKFSKALSEEVITKRLLEQAEQAFTAGDYAKAAELAKKLMLEHREAKEAGPAAQLLAKAQREARVAKTLAQAEDQLQRGHYDAAEKTLSELLGDPQIKSSRQRERVQATLKRIPREREADKLWLLAKADLDRDDLDKARGRLETLAREYADTGAGARANQWLAETEQRLAAKARQADQSKQIDSGLFAGLLDPAPWRAASATNLAGRARGASRPEMVQDPSRQPAWHAFDNLMVQDLARLIDDRSKALHLVLPLLAGLALLGFMGLHLGRPGPGLSGPAGENAPIQKGADPPAPCRMCGHPLERDKKDCSICGASASLTGVEANRQADASRKGDFDPWQMRVRADKLNQFDVFYQKAKDLARTGQIEPAIDACRKALREDPHQAEGYELLATLYEKNGERPMAIVCYREILLLDPTAQVVRQKLESLQPSLTGQSVRLRPMMITLICCFWWLAYWLLMGINPRDWLYRSLGTVLGAVATFFLWQWFHQRFPPEVKAAEREKADLDLPLPHGRLAWGEQHRQARLLADKIREHTGVAVPALGAWRIVAALVLAGLLLAVTIDIAWMSHLPWALLGWPAGLVLLVYGLDLFPRSFTALVMLRHLYEETHSPWADPHRPFVPKGTPRPVRGEFLVSTMQEFPLYWAFNPYPFRPTRQGLLNSLQQTFNRHMGFHRFYDQLRIMADFEMPLPSGVRELVGLTVLALVLGAAGLGWLHYDHVRKASQYEEGMKLGYGFLLGGDPLSARDEFEKARAIEPERTAPYLYLGHAYAAANKPALAGQNFREALDRTPNSSTVQNDYGNFLQRQGKLRDAIPAYQAALHEDPGSADILNNIGAAHYKLKDYAQAEEYLIKATRARPDHDRAWTTLGLVYEALGRDQKARDAFAKAVQVAPTNPYTAVARGRLTGGLQIQPSSADQATTASATPSLSMTVPGKK